MSSQNTTKSAPIKLIMGLRNPGQQYADTRHNAGQWLIDKLLRAHNLLLKQHKTWPIEIAKLNDMALLLSTTYMNHSGEGLGQYCRYYRLKPENVLLVYDDLDLPVGAVKLKFSGGDGGHNGIRSVASHLQSKAFWRLRIGIGRCSGTERTVSDYVLSKPSVADREQIDCSIDQALQNFHHILAGDFEAFMRVIHTKQSPKPQTK